MATAAAAFTTKRILRRLGFGFLAISRYSTDPRQPIVGKTPQWITADEAVQGVTSGMRIYVQPFSATPNVLLAALTEHGKRARLHNVELIHILTEGAAPYAEPDCQGIFRSNSLFIGSNLRKAVNEGRADFTPICLGEIPLLFRRKVVKLDVALIQVSPPDKHGFCSLGTNIDCTRAAIENVPYIIAQVNCNMPHTFGDGIVHCSHFDAMVQADNDLPELPVSESTEAESRISQFIAENLVDDGATLQMGIGSIPNVVLSKLTEHKDLGIHSEMFSDGIIPLINKGVITNAKKVIQTGKIVGTFVYGTRKLYDFINWNSLVEMLDVATVNSPAVIAQNPRVTAINSCIEVDLTGQVVSDSIGTRMYSGVGGQIDFIQGAALGLDGLGKPILAMPSTTAKGESKIVPFLKSGGGVVTTRAHVHYIVTEYGIAYLVGKHLRQRAYELIRISHPTHREWLEKEAFQLLKVMPSP